MAKSNVKPEKNVKHKIKKSQSNKTSSSTNKGKNSALFQFFALIISSSICYYYHNKILPGLFSKNNEEIENPNRLDKAFPSVKNYKLNSGNLESSSKYSLTCANNYKPVFLQSKNPDDEKIKSECVPDQAKNCGRFFTNGLEENILTIEEIQTLQKMAEIGTMVFNGGAGGPSIIEMVSGVASFKNSFLGVFSRMEQGDQQTIDKMLELYSDENLKIYEQVKNKVANLIAKQFEIKAEDLYLSRPTFFSRITNKAPVSPNDEYWHSHVDINQYPDFHYTSLIYLSNYGSDFTGGRFIFEQKSGQEKYGSTVNHVVEPKVGMISAFSSGDENKHRVEAVESGVRYAFTMGFTCNKEVDIGVPRIPENVLQKVEKSIEENGKDEL